MHRSHHQGVERNARFLHESTSVDESTGMNEMRMIKTQLLRTEVEAIIDGK